MPAGFPIGAHRDPIRVRRLHVVVGRMRIGAGDDDQAQLPATGHEFTKHVALAKPGAAVMERHLRRIIGHATPRAEAHRVRAGALEVVEPELGIELARVILDERELRPAHGFVHPARRRRSHRRRVDGIKLRAWPSSEREQRAAGTSGLKEATAVHGD